MRVCSIDSQHELWKRRGLRPLGKRRRRFPLSHSSGDYWGRLKLYYHAYGSWGQVRTALPILGSENGVVDCSINFHTPLLWCASIFEKPDSAPQSALFTTCVGYHSDNHDLMAEGEGFEPPVRFPVQRFSRPPVSTAHASLRTACVLDSLAACVCPPSI